MNQSVTFSSLLETLITNRTRVTIGSGENELQGVIVAFDPAHKVFTYTEHVETGTTHFIPLSSIRSIGYEELPNGASCYLDLFRK